MLDLVITGGQVVTRRRASTRGWRTQQPLAASEGVWGLR